MKRTAALVALLALLTLAPAGAASAAPLEGRWEARGDGGARINFVVTRAHGRLIAAHPVSFCGSYGEPIGTEDFRRENLVGVGGRFEADYEPIGPGGRVRDLWGFRGDLRHSGGRVSWATRYDFGGPPELGYPTCPRTAFRDLAAERVGPVRVKDGYWDLSGSLGSDGWLESYAGGSLVRIGGNFGALRDPRHPTAPCSISAGGTGAGFFGSAIPMPADGSTFAGGATVNTFGIVDSLSAVGHFTGPDWAYGSYSGFFSYLSSLTCPGIGFWLARHQRGVVFEDVPEGPGPRPPENPPEPPHEHWPPPPPSGPDDFACVHGNEADNPPASDLCKIYIRTPASNGTPAEEIGLLWGNRRYGFRHIRRRHGFSRKTDALIAQTITATPDPQADGSTRYEREFTSGGTSCVVRIVVNQTVGIHTAFVLGYPDGRFSRCPWPPGARLPVPSEAADYVALGDSYSSGEGVPPFDPETNVPGNRCHRSARAYSRAFSPSGYTLNRSFFACSGAVTDNVGRADASGVIAGTPQKGEPTIQLGRLAAEQWQATDLVTLTIGGNDAQFADVLKQCVIRACHRGQRADAIIARIANEVPPLLASTYAAIRQRTPNATTLVLGYPQLFPSEPRRRCPIGKRVVSRAKQVFLRERGEQLNEVIRGQAAAAGFHFVGVEQAFGGHEPCGPKQEWIHALVLPIGGGETVFSFHPNRAGQLGYANRLEGYLACLYQSSFPFEPSGVPAPVSAAQPGPAGC